jgi:hypothetical protein
MEVNMSTPEVGGSDESSVARVARVDLRLEVVVIPVSDIDRAEAFYEGLGWRLDADFQFDNGFRGVQFTPPGSACSIQFGTKKTSAAPGSAQGLYLIVTDIEAARDALVVRVSRSARYSTQRRRARSSSWATRAAAGAGLHQIARATAPLQPSATRTATAGCFRK